MSRGGCGITPRWTRSGPTPGSAWFPQKTAGRQRKLLMAVAGSAMLEDPRLREDHGLLGGGALADLHLPSGALELAAFDEDNAFTRIKVPRCFALWMACPPIRADLVWEVLDPEMKKRTNNVQVVGRTFRAQRLLCAAPRPEKRDMWATASSAAVRWATDVRGVRRDCHRTPSILLVGHGAGRLFEHLRAPAGLGSSAFVAAARLGHFH